MVFNTLRGRATQESLPVYLVGGPVRDAVLDVPANDLDFVLIGDAPTLASDLAEELGGQVTVHPRFGTATVEIEGDRIDIVTARKEVYPFPGSLPEVSASSLEDDLARRDFSINAMALPLSGDSPEVIDPHGGLEGLAYRRVATLHPGSFTDDPSRMLRAVRYEQRLGLQISDTTLSEMQSALAGRHADALEDLEEQHREDPGGDEEPEPVVGHLPYSPDPQEQEADEGKEGRTTHEAGLLRDHGEDEIGLLLRHQGRVVLGALEEAPAGEATVADGHLRLLEVVAGRGIGLVVYEDEQAPHLVLLEDVRLQDPNQACHEEQAEDG